MYPLAGQRVRPYDHRHAAHSHLHPDARNDGSQPLNLGGGDPDLRHVHIECRHQVDEHQAHAVHLPAIVLAGKSVSRLMNEAEGQEQHIKLHHIHKRFLGEVVVERDIGSHDAPF